MPIPYVETLLEENASVGATTLIVKSTEKMESGNNLGVITNVGSIFWTTINTVPDLRTLTIVNPLTIAADAGNLVVATPEPPPRPPVFYQRSIQPPDARGGMNLADAFRWLYDLWQRTGGYDSYVADLQGLRATVVELNYSVGLSGPIQPQLDGKLTPADVGDMAYQEPNNVAITGGNISGVGITGANISTTTITGGDITGTNVSGVDITDSTATFIVGNTANTRRPMQGITANTVAVPYPGTGEQDLITYTLPANTMAFNGDFIEIDAWGEFAANANTKRLRAYFGSALLYDTGDVAANDGAWQIKAKVVRVAAASQQAITSIITGNTLIPAACDYITGSEDLTSGVIIKITAECTAASDVTQHGLTTFLSSTS